MADLPSFRFAEAEKQYPFLNVGLDFFGPFYIEHRKHKLNKQYVCLVTRAVHRIWSLVRYWTQIFAY